MKTIQKSNQKYTKLTEFIQSRCVELNIKMRNSYVIYFGDKKIPKFFSIDKNTDKYEVFEEKEFCSECEGFSVSELKLENVEDVSKFKIFNECSFCLKNILTQNTYRKYKINFTKNKEITGVVNGENYIKMETSFKKSFEHYETAKTLSKNLLTIEQSVVNYSECIEKILKGFAYSYGATLSRNHCLEILLNELILVNPEIRHVFNKKLIKSLEIGYDILRYKEQKLNINSRLIIDIGIIRKEFDYMIFRILDFCFFKKSENDDFFIYSIWNFAKTEFDCTATDLTEQCKNKISIGTREIREIVYFRDGLSKNLFLIEKNYMTEDSQCFFIKIEKNISTQYSQEMSKTFYNIDKSKKKFRFINNKLYVRK